MREKVYRNQLWLRGKNKREPLSALRATTKERREGLQLKLKEMEGWEKDSKGDYSKVKVCQRSGVQSEEQQQSASRRLSVVRFVRLWVQSGGDVLVTLSILTSRWYER